LTASVALVIFAAMPRGAALAATVIGLLFAGGAPAQADAPVPGDTRETAIPLSLGVPATAATSGARREAGDPEGGHSVWFRFDSPVQGAYAVDFGGTDFDAVSAFAQTGPLGPNVLDGYDAPHPSVQVGFLVHSYGSLAIRVDGVEPEDVGTARVTVRSGPAPEDAWANPVALDLAGTAVASASPVLASAGLEPGEPGAADERQSVWFAFTAPRDGRLALDRCLPPGLGTSASAGVLRILDDRPLGQAAVLAEGAMPDIPQGCTPVELDVRAGERYRVQVTQRTRFNDLAYGAVALRGRMAGTPPAVTARSLTECSGGTCTPTAEVLPAPGAELASVECRVENDAWGPCTRRADGIWAGRSFSSPGETGRHRFAVRATDSAGRTAKVLEQYNSAVPAAGGPGPAPFVPPRPPGVTPPPLRLAPRPRALPLPRARFAVTRRGSRVRSLTAPGLPARATVTLGCRGRGCPLSTRRRTAARYGTVSLTPMLRRALLRPGARVTVTVRARGRATRSATWRMRARRAPVRVVSP